MTTATNTPIESSESMPNMPNMPMDASIQRRTRPNPDQLPYLHVIDWLQQAKERYTTELPPFVERNEGSNRAGLRKKVTLLVTDDQQQGLPVEAEIICWSWNVEWTFYTIDIGGRRLIIKGYPGDRYCHYSSWLGPKKGFSFQYIAYGRQQKDSEDPKPTLRTQLTNKIRKSSDTAYSESSAKPNSRAQQPLIKAQHASTQHTSRREWRSSGFSPINPPNLSSTRPTSSDFEYLKRQHNAQGQQYHVRIESKPQAASPSVKDSSRPMETDIPDVQIISGPIRRDGQHGQHGTQTKLDRPRQNEPSPKANNISPNSPHDSIKVTPSQRPSTEAPGARKDHPTTSTVHDDKAAEIQNAQHTSPESANESATSKRPHGNITNIPPPSPKPQNQGETSAESNTQSRPSKRKREASSLHPTNLISPQLSTTQLSTTQLPTTQSTHSSPHHQTTPTTPSTDPEMWSFIRRPSFTIPQLINQPPESSSSSATSIPPPLTTEHKHAHTILYIAIPCSKDVVPLKLRSCATLPSLFDTIVPLSDPLIALGKSDMIVTAIRATFAWKGKDDMDKMILLKREVQDTWEIFMEIIDKAPCWGVERGGGEGRCDIMVEVVLI